MKISLWIILATLALPLAAFAQDPAPPQAEPGGPGLHVQTRTRMIGGPGPGGPITIHREMGKWWKDSELAKKLKLGDNQIAQLDQVFYDHKLKLIDDGAEMEKEDLKLQNLLDADTPNESQVGSQVDRVLAARGKLEREYTMMNLDLRKVLSVEQWRELKSVRNERDPGPNVLFYQRLGPGPGPGSLPALPALPLGPGGDDPW